METEAFSMWYRDVITPIIGHNFQSAAETFSDEAHMVENCVTVHRIVILKCVMTEMVNH